MASYVGNSPEDILKTRRRNYYYTASAAQTTFTGADDNSNTLNVNENDLEVFMNGVLLDQSDYTANTTHIVLSSAAAASDIIEVQTFNDYFVDSNFSRFGGNISGNIIPTANNTYTLGNTTNRFADLYLSGSTLHLGAQTITSNATHVSMSGSQSVTALDVSGQITATSTNGNILNLYRSGGASDSVAINLYDGSQDRAQIKSVDGNISFHTAGVTERMRIDSSGNIGIGTTSTTAGQVTIQGTGSPRQLVITDDGAEKLQIFQIGNDATIEAASGGSSSTNLIFKTSLSGAEAERLRIDSNGRLGVNFTPTGAGAKVFIGGSTNRGISNATADEGIILVPSSNLTTGEYAPYLTFTPSIGNPNRARAAIGAVSTNGTAAMDLIFATRSAADGSEITGNDERMRIDSSGNVTVKGTNRDMLILHRQSTTGDAGIEFKNNTGTRNQLLMLHGGEMRVDILGSERYSFQNLNGNSIFAVEPSSTGGAGAGGAFLKFKGSNSTAVDIAAIDGSMVDGTAGAEDGILAFFTMQNGTLTQRMQINNVGNVGINENNPAAMLHIQNKYDVTSYTNAAGILLERTGGGQSWLMSAGVSGVSNSYLAFRDTTNSRYLLTFTNTGFVGVGTAATQPTATFATTNQSTFEQFYSASGTDKSIVGNLHRSVYAGTAGTDIDAFRNVGTHHFYQSSTTTSGTRPTNHGTVMILGHYSGEYGLGARYITQIASGHANNPALYARNTDVTNGTAWGTWYSFDLTSTSDERSKTNIVNAPSQIDLVRDLRVVEFDYIDNDDEPRQLGLIAQEVDVLAPEYVTKDEEDEDIMWRVKYNKMVPMLIKSLQEALDKIETLESRLDAAGL